MANMMRFNVEILTAAQQKYNQYAEQISTLMGEINRLVADELSQGWEGDSYNAFRIQNENEVKPAFQKMQQALDVIASQINTAVKNAIAADQASKVC